MKKILSLLMVSSMSITLASQVVACNKPDSETAVPETSDYLKIGLDIDKTYAYDDSVDREQHFGFSNYYVIGDSLSDMDGLTTFFSDYFGETGKNEESLYGINEFNLKFQEGYGFSDTESWRNPFTNGEPAAYAIAKELNFTNLESSNYFKKLDKNLKTDYGNNYAVGGATAADFDSLVSKLLFNNYTTIKQTQALIQQHKIGENDLVVFQIGPNDLFAINEINNQNDIDKAIKNAMDSITYTFFSLLNNGIKNIVFMTPPPLEDIPLYYESSSEIKEKIRNIGAKFNTDLLKVIELVKSYYPENVEFYDLFKDFKNVKEEYASSEEYNTAESKDKLILTRGYASEKKLELESPNLIEGESKNYKFELDSFDPAQLFEFLAEVQERKELIGHSIDIEGTMTMKYNSTKNSDQNIENYFFVDDVHPSKGVHKYVGLEKILPIINNNFIKK